MNFMITLGISSKKPAEILLAVVLNMLLNSDDIGYHNRVNPFDT